jgi:hypothetical protein
MRGSEQISRLTQDVWADGIWSDSKKVAVTVESEGDNLVDGMGSNAPPPPKINSLSGLQASRNS